MSSSRLTRPLLLFLFLALLSTAPHAARAEIVHGFLTARPDYFPGCCIGCGEAFDFSAQTIVRHDAAGADLCFFEPANNIDFWEFLSLGGSGIQRAARGESLGGLMLAPEGGYKARKNIVLEGVYVILTGDGLYAKLGVHETSMTICCHLTIEFYVQLDGTRNLDQRVPVEQSTWGRVKALYQ